MSYINEALHKVQKEKESPYASYGEIVLAADKKPDPMRMRFSAIGLLVVFCYAAGMIVFLYWPEINQKPRAGTMVQVPVVVTVPPLQNVTIQGAPPAGVPEPVASGSAVVAEVAVPIPVSIEKKSTVNTLPVAGKEKKQNVTIPAGGMTQKTSSKTTRTDTIILYAQALQKQNEGKLEEAKALYEKVIKENPRHVSALNNLGVIFMRQNMNKQAIINFNKALHVRHNYVDAHYNLACLYAQSNDAKKSLFNLKNAIDLNPEVRQWSARDDDLKNIADLPEFKKIIQERDK